jgi:hypothetical protein
MPSSFDYYIAQGFENLKLDRVWANDGDWITLCFFGRKL